MMRSMFSGVSGLRIHQTKMDVLANNISNVNTVGYKSSRVTFNEVFSQNLSGASGPNNETGKGGINAKQIGLGAGLASIDRIMTQGAAQRTDNNYDVMIQGSGFFVVGDGTNQYFTRVGTFDVDPAGNLIVSGTGMKVYGWDTDEKDEIVKGLAQPLVIAGDKEFAKAKATTEIEFEGNLKPEKVGEYKDATMDFYDSIGNSYRITLRFTFNGDDWTAEMLQDYNVDGDPIGVAATVNGKSDRKVHFLFDSTTFNVAFNPDGSFKELVDPNAGGGGAGGGAGAGGAGGAGEEAVVVDKTKLGLRFPNPMPPTDYSAEAYFGKYDIAADGTASPGLITIDFSGLYQFANKESNAKVSYADGRKAGELNQISIGDDGVITGTYSNGMLRTLGQIPVARFSNPGGLESIGGNLFRLTSNSGRFDGVGEEASMGEEKLQAGTLEMSTVDLASEFTEMITTQRGFQANSRIISTSDELLQELVNLKR